MNQWRVTLRVCCPALLVLGLLLFASLGAGAREIVVTSTADRGTGTLRWALQAAQSGDTITFDPAVFPPDEPATILLQSELPPIFCGQLTIDASDAGVIISGSNIPGDWNNGLQVYSGYNTVMGLQIVNFAGSGIVVAGVRNTIGGDRRAGLGPVGKGNLSNGNAIGIDICDVGTHDNIVLGNLVGVLADGATPRGEHTFGILVEAGAQNNKIGPENVVTHGEYGVIISGSSTVRNTITQNSIYANTDSDIALWHGGNERVDAPAITSFDAEAGTISGCASSGGTVEIFIGDSLEERTYLGSATVPGTGVFSLSTRRQLLGTFLSATSTDPSGNTSRFSLPVGGSGTSLILQVDNSRGKTPLETTKSENLGDNRIGGNWKGLWSLSADQLEDLFQDDLREKGLTRADMSVNNADWYRDDMTRPELSIDPLHDRLFTQVASAGVEVAYSLNFWDKAGSCLETPFPRFQSEEDIQRYLDFVAFTVEHFKGRVQRYIIWNEPDLGGSIQYVEVDDYINLVRRAIPVVRAIDPAAKIVVGPTTYLMEPESSAYLFELLQSDLMSEVDAICWNAMLATSPALPEHRDYYYEYPSIARQIKQMAIASGFKGEFGNVGMSWWTTIIETDHPDSWAYASDILCAKYLARGALLHLGMDVAIRVGFVEPQFASYPMVQRLCFIMDGHEAIDLLVEIDIDYEPVAYCAFTCSDGDRLIALWSDGIAQDEDPGIPATIRIPGLAAGTVTGIDVLHGFEQELAFEIEDGDTVVRDLLVKDYPILIELSDITFGPDYEEIVGDGFHRLGEPGGN